MDNYGYVKKQQQHIKAYVNIEWCFDMGLNMA